MKAAIDKSRLFKRAWYLVKQIGYSISQALKIVWAEMKEYAAKQKAIADETERLEKWHSSTEYKAMSVKTLDCSNYYNRPSGSYYGD